MSVLEKLTEGIVKRDLAKEGAALLNKWERTGLLEGINSDSKKQNMARLLENQAKELLREASTMSAGDVEGFAAVAFPIVRRVFGSLIANDLVSVQPMSLPSGLIFFLDFRFGSERDAAGAGNDQVLDYVDDDSIYGQGVIGSQLTGGVSINEDKQPYGFQYGYGSPTGSIDLKAGNVKALALTRGQVGDGGDIDKLVRWDPDLASGTYIAVYTLDTADAQLVASGADIASPGGLANLVVASGTLDTGVGKGFIGQANCTDVAVDMQQVRRLTHFSGSSKTVVNLIFTGSDDLATNTANLGDTADDIFLYFAIKDEFVAGSGIGSVVGSSSFGWGLEENPDIPEIEIQVDSVSVTAKTKKLKAKWTPELGQDLNAYHNLDAEVELTSILSEQIALEIDREILDDLVKGGTAATYYWSRSPGLFVNKTTGVELGASSAAPDFTGTVSEWYETLIETVNDVSAQIHRKTLRGGANFLVCGPEVANILEFTSGFRANVSHEDAKGTVGAVNVGSISKKFDVMVDPYFPRNAILVGRKGNSFLESGYVYAPYVPLQTTPTIFGTEDFVPRKGVMTRYAKKMVRPDMYGLVIIRGMLGEEGSN